jgi:hypothetical protein
LSPSAQNPRLILAGFLCKSHTQTKNHPDLIMLRSFASQKYRSSLHQLLLIERLQVRQFSNPSSSLPLINASNRDTNHQENPLLGSFLKWASGITVGSGLGLLYWSHSHDSDSALFTKPFLSFADSSTPIAESTVDDPPSTSSFRKVALPQIPKYLFGGI